MHVFCWQCISTIHKSCCQFVLPGIYARTRKAVLATDATQLRIVLYFLHSTSEYPFVSAILISHKISSIPFRYLWWYVHALLKHPLFSASMPYRHPLSSGSILVFLLCEGLKTGSCPGLHWFYPSFLTFPRCCCCHQYYLISAII